MPGLSQTQILNEVYNTDYNQYEYDGSDNLVYAGGTDTFNASDDDNVWIIVRMWWSAGNLVKKKKLRNVAWADRASLDW